MEPRYSSDKRDGYTYDVAIKRGDSTFWMERTGALAIDSTGDTIVLRVSGDRFHSYLQHIFGDFEFQLTIPANPGATTDQTWGLRNPSDTQVSCAYFSIDTNSAFTCKTGDNYGNLQSSAVTWDTNWSDTAVTYRIRWEEDVVNFLINDTVVATHSTRVGTKPQSLELRNATASNMDVRTIRVTRAGAII